MSGPLHVLYIVYWGATEPLGQSLVLPAIREMARTGIRLTLVTFEKANDATEDNMAPIRSSLMQHHVRWIPLRYHKRPTVPATAFDIQHGTVRAILASLGRRPDVVHARTFVGGLIGAMVASIVRAPLVYHAEGFYAEERVDAGFWSETSSTYRVVDRLDSELYGHARGIIVLSGKARDTVTRMEAVTRRRTPVIVVPSCVDLEHFPTPDERVPPRSVQLVYSGSVEGRYAFDAVARFAAIAAEEAPSTRLRVLTKADPALVAGHLGAATLPSEATSVAAASYQDMPGELARSDAGLHFLRRGRSEHGGSPTKVGEYWASGLPIVTTPNAGDTDEIVHHERVGVVVEDTSDEAYRAAFRSLRELLAEPGIRMRCRKAAESHYALRPACDQQIELYRSLASGTERPTT